MNEIKVSAENIHKAFREARSSEAKELLINLFGKDAVEPEQPKNVTERIKTFEDAYNELGSEHQYCKAWDSIYQGNENDDCEDIKDVIAYHKIRIIAAALNEGWKPEFTKDEYRYYPYYYFYTKEEYENFSDEDKENSRAVGRSFSNANAYDGLVYADVHHAFSNLDFGSRLVFKNRELAEYAGMQFIDIYADFLG